MEVENVLTEPIGFLYSNRNDSLSRYKLIDDIIANLTFDKKIKILKKNIDIEFGVFKKYNTIVKDLNEIREIRNQIAHRNISYPWIFGEDHIDENNYNFLTEKYIDWKEKCDFQKPGKDYFSYSLTDLNQYQKKCELLILVLRVGLAELLSPIMA